MEVIVIVNFIFSAAVFVMVVRGSLDKDKLRKQLTDRDMEISKLRNEISELKSISKR